MKYAVAAFVLAGIYSLMWPVTGGTFTRDQAVLLHLMIGCVAAVGAGIGLPSRAMRSNQPLPDRVMDAVRHLESEKPNGMSGYEISHEMGGSVGYGTFYRALRKLEDSGVLVSWWADDGRRLYRRVVR